MAGGGATESICSTNISSFTLLHCPKFLYGVFLQLSVIFLLSKSRNKWFPFLFLFFSFLVFLFKIHYATRKALSNARQNASSIVVFTDQGQQSVFSAIKCYLPRIMHMYIHACLPLEEKILLSSRLLSAFQSIPIMH